MMITVLAVPDLFDSGLSAVLDVLAAANALRQDVATPAHITALAGRARGAGRLAQVLLRDVTPPGLGLEDG